jgi:hypothetical protein
MEYDYRANMEALFQFCTQQVDKIPGTFWGVVVGSLFTLTGIYFTNRASEHRQREQLKSDRELSNREREMAFRKETYAAATEAIALSLGSISKFCDLSVSLKEISTTHSNLSPIIAKVNLVAGEATIRALSNYGTEFARAYMRLSQQRMALSILQEQIAVKVALVKGFEKTRDTMLELMQHHNIEGVQDDRRFQILKDNFDFEAGRIATTYQEIQQMTNELVAKHTPFAKECFADSIRLNGLLVPALVSAREELELSISKEKYAEILYHAQSKLELDMDEFIQKVSDERDAATISQ